jgi:hypothetical protein
LTVLSILTKKGGIGPRTPPSGTPGPLPFSFCCPFKLEDYVNVNENVLLRRCDCCATDEDLKSSGRPGVFIVDEWQFPKTGLCKRIYQEGREEVNVDVIEDVGRPGGVIYEKCYRIPLGAQCTGDRFSGGI